MPEVGEAAIAAAALKRNVSTVFTHPAVIAALATALVGGVAATIITELMQGRARERELALSAFKDYATAEIDAVRRAYELVGRYLAATEDLIYITGEEFDSPAADTEKTAVVKEYNTAEQEWRRSRDSVGFLLGHYHAEMSEVTPAWRNLDDDFRIFNTCARKWYKVHMRARESEVSKACDDEHRKLLDGIDRLTRVLQQDRQLLWDDFGIDLRKSKH